MSAITVLGAGIAGLAAAQKLKEAGRSPVVYEKNAEAGGHTRSHEREGFIFDEGPHVSFTGNAQIAALFEKAVSGRFREQDSLILNDWNGVRMPHPVQCNLFGLPVELIDRVVRDFKDAPVLEGRTPDSYDQWCLAAFGKTFSEEFVFKYTRKYWTTEASNMTTDWIGPRVHRPTLEQVTEGAEKSAAQRKHYLTKFRYPDKGGFASYVDPMASGLDIRFGCDVAFIDTEARTLLFADGKEECYGRLISSLPLPELVARIRQAPPAVVEAAKRLVCTSLVLVNVAIERSEGLPDAHWMYFYDEDVVFSRVNFPHRLSRGNAPEGCGSIQAEIYHSRYQPLPEGDVAARCVDDLRRKKILLPEDRIRFVGTQKIEYANVLFDKNRAPSLQVVKAYLDRLGIVTCGRYGEWGYFWTDDSILSGWNAALKILT